jgi:ABC-type antimicrobial peptide transport system permease subunit
LSGVEREVVGVVGDVKVTSSGFFLNGMMKGPITSGPLIYLPAAQTPDGFLGMHIWFSPMWTVRTSNPAVAEEALQHAMSAADPMLPLGRIQRMVDIQAAATARQRLLMILVGVLGGAAVLLAAIGIHGLIAHSVQQRTREFGIRLALGATAGGTIRDVAMSGILIAFGGAVVGVGLAVLAVRVMESLVSSDYLWGVSSRAPGTYVEVALFLVAIAAVASVLPALRILRVDPAETLRA